MVLLADCLLRGRRFYLGQENKDVVAAFYVLGCPTRGILSIVSVALVIYVLVSLERLSPVPPSFFI
jgi:hypothetical protein